MFDRHVLPHTPRRFIFSHYLRHALMPISRQTEMPMITPLRCRLLTAAMPPQTSRLRHAIEPPRQPPPPPPYATLPYFALLPKTYHAEHRREPLSAEPPSPPMTRPRRRHTPSLPRHAEGRQRRAPAVRRRCLSFYRRATPNSRSPRLPFLRLFNRDSQMA